MNSRYWRTLASQYLFGVVLDYGLCLVASYLIFEQDRIGNAFLLLLGLWALQIALGLKNLIVSVLTYYLYRKQRMRKEFEIALHKQHFPQLDDGYMTDSVEYMAQVAQDAKSEKNQTITAAMFLGQVEILKAVKPSLAMQVMSAMDSALDLYRYRLATSTTLVGGSSAP